MGGLAPSQWSYSYMAPDRTPVSVAPGKLVKDESNKKSFKSFASANVAKLRPEKRAASRKQKTQNKNGRWVMGNGFMG